MAAPPQRFANSDDADIIIRSQNGVEFHVHKVILALASPYFKRMFSLPSSGDGQSLLLNVPESGQIWESLLQLCYPIDSPSFQNIDAIAELIPAAIKYEFPHAIKEMRKELRSYISSNALDVFAIAYRLDLQEEAREAASNLHPKNPKNSIIYSARPVIPANFPSGFFDIDVPETPSRYATRTSIDVPKAPTRFEWPRSLDGKTFSPKIQSLLSAGDLFRLLNYLRTKYYPTFYSWDPVPAESTQPTTIPEFGFDTSDADLILKSSDDVEFRVHKLIIFLASANHLGNLPIESDTDTLPVIRLSENSNTLGTLISMCYPANVDFEDLSVVYEVLKAAMKYEMKKIIQTLQVKLSHNIKRDPLRIYFISTALGLKEEAIKASKLFALSSDDSANTYVREMEVAPAITYHRLLKYRYQYRAAAVGAWEGDLRLSALRMPSELTEERTRILRIIENSTAKVELELDPDIVPFRQSRVTDYPDGAEIGIATGPIDNLRSMIKKFKKILLSRK